MYSVCCTIQVLPCTVLNPCLCLRPSCVRSVLDRCEDLLCAVERDCARGPHRWIRTEVVQAMHTPGKDESLRVLEDYASSGGNGSTRLRSQAVAVQPVIFGLAGSLSEYITDALSALRLYEAVRADARWRILARRYGIQKLSGRQQMRRKI